MSTKDIDDKVLNSILNSLSNTFRISKPNARELAKLFDEENSKGCTFTGGVSVSVAKRMMAEHPREKDFKCYVNFVSALRKIVNKMKRNQKHRPQNPVTVWEDMSKAVQLKLFDYKSSSRFRSYMDQP